MTRILIVILIIGFHKYTFSQIVIDGKVIDSGNQHALVYVNIGIKKKNIGTITSDNGSFTIKIPIDYQSDSLTFSMVGYYDSTLLIQDLITQKDIIVRLNEKIIQLQEVVIAGEKLVEKKYGIRRRGLVHFTDGIFRKDDSFEIGQVINLGNSGAFIRSINLHINSSRPDRANFRINFYKYDTKENIPGVRIFEKSILQRHPIKEGWLEFDLSEYNILLKGSVLATIEFIPNHAPDSKKILYEVKIGGISKSFFRRSSLGEWIRPPHHYCLYVTASNDKSAPAEPEDVETTPTFMLKSDFAKEPFCLFVRVAKDYEKKNSQRFPVVYLLDGNAFFDPIVDAADRLSKKKSLYNDPIIVGIGYENAYVMDSLRDRDYTYPKALESDSFKISGQGDKFYRFIKTDVIPYIDSVYRTDKGNRTIMGHSLGGYFALFALTRQLKDTLVFSNFVAASPSINYHDNYLIKEISRSPPNMKNRDNVNLYLTIGELENVKGQLLDVQEIANALEGGARTQTEIFKNYEHMGTAIPTFEKGIKFFMTRKKLKNDHQ